MVNTPLTQVSTNKETPPLKELVEQVYIYRMAQLPVAIA